MTKDEAPKDCRRMFARLSDYLDGELAPALCDELRAHLDGCTPCEAFAGTLERTVDLCRALPSRALPDDLRAELRVLLERQGIR